MSGQEEVLTPSEATARELEEELDARGISQHSLLRYRPPNGVVNLHGPQSEASVPHWMKYTDDGA